MGVSFFHCSLQKHRTSSCISNEYDGRIKLFKTQNGKENLRLDYKYIKHYLFIFWFHKAPVD